MINQKRWWHSMAWYAYDVGNSAHALMISSVAFALYFSQYLLSDNPNSGSVWGILTALILALSAAISPILGSYFAHINRRGLGLLIITLICVSATALLSLPFEKEAAIAVITIYAISSLGYYLALPLYNSFLPEIASDSLQRTSAKGWAWGYTGGIAVVLIALALGLLEAPVAERPDLYRSIFLLAAIFNFVCSVPLMLLALKYDKLPKIETQFRWRVERVIRILNEQPAVLRLLLAYWMVSEAATIVVYFTAIFLGQYAGLEAPRILMLTLLAQGGAFVSTWAIGWLASGVGGKRVFIGVAFIWIVVPILLSLVSSGISYWPALIGMALVLGAHHALIRGRIGEELIVSELNKTDQGALWGYLEVAGRMSQVLGPLIIGFAALFLSLDKALLFACIFPVIALFMLRGYQWDKAS